MSQYLGKNDFRLGLTTDIRGTFGNNAVLNTCHGFNPCSGDLIPIPSKGASESTIGFDSTAKDFVIEYGGNFYSFNDFLNRNYTSILTVKQFFGSDIELYSKPVVSGKQILYPTNKGLFSLEPNAYTGKSSVRYLSFMSPEDYTDTTENKPTATNPSVDRLRLFTTTNWRLYSYKRHNILHISYLQKVLLMMLLSLKLQAMPVLLVFQRLLVLLLDIQAVGLYMI